MSQTERRGLRSADRFDEQDEQDELEPAEGNDGEQHSFLSTEYDNHNQRRSLAAKWDSRAMIFSKVMAVVNLVLGVLLTVSLAVVARSTGMSCAVDIPEPYCAFHLQNEFPIFLGSNEL